MIARWLYRRRLGACVKTLYDIHHVHNLVRQWRHSLPPGYFGY